MLKAYECALKEASKGGKLSAPYSIEALRVPHYLPGRDMDKFKYLAPLSCRQV